MLRKIVVLALIAALVGLGVVWVGTIPAPVRARGRPPQGGVNRIYAPRGFVYALYVPLASLTLSAVE